MNELTNKACGRQKSPVTPGPATLSPRLAFVTCSLSLKHIFFSGQSPDEPSILSFQVTASGKPTLRLSSPTIMSSSSGFPQTLKTFPILIPQPSSLDCISRVSTGFTPAVHSRYLISYQATKMLFPHSPHKI